LSVLRKDRCQIIGSGQQVEVVAGNPERLVFLSIRSHKDGRKDQVVRIFRILSQRFLRVLVAFDRIAF